MVQYCIIIERQGEGAKYQGQSAVWPRVVVSKIILTQKKMLEDKKAPGEVQSENEYNNMRYKP